MERLNEHGGVAAAWDDGNRSADGAGLRGAPGLEHSRKADTSGMPDMLGRPDVLEKDIPAKLGHSGLSREEVEALARALGGGAENVQDIYPLTPLQEGLLFHHVLDESGDTYVLSTLFELESQALVQRFIDAVQAVVDAHDALRIAVVWEGVPRPVQVVLRRALVPVEYVVLEASRSPREQLRERSAPPQPKWDLGRGPLARLQVALEPSGTGAYAVLQLHHVVCDYGTLRNVLSEMAAHLEGRADFERAPLPYREHVMRALAGAKREDAEAFFRAKLQGVEEPALPFGLAALRAGASMGREIRRGLESALSVRLRSQAKRLGVSVARLFHAVWALVVARTCGREDVVFGTVVLSSWQRAVTGSRILGMSINTLPLRLRLGGVTVGGLAEYVNRELAELLEYEQAPLVVAQGCSGLAASTPLFNTLLNFRHAALSSGGGRGRGGGLDPGNGVDSGNGRGGGNEWDCGGEWGGRSGMRLLGIQEARTSYPVALIVDDVGDGFDLTVQTDGRVDPARMVAYVSGALGAFLDALDDTPEAPALSLACLPEEERRLVTETFNATRRPYPQQTPIQTLFERQADSTPGAPAVIWGDEALTYAELECRANRLANYLCAGGVEVGEYIPILMPRCAQSLVAQLAILKAGAAYVPIDPELPQERQAFLIRDCGGRRVLTEGGKPEIRGLETLQWIDCAGGDIGKFPSSRPVLVEFSGATEVMPAYVMYTSGSTGAPKGVVVPHRAVVRLVANNSYAPIGAMDCIAHCSNPAFDASTFEVWGALLNGARVLVVPRPVLLEAESFAALLTKHQVSVLWLTVGLFAQYVGPLAGVFSRLRYLMTGGDVVDPELVRRVMRGGAPEHLLNAYGPTECTTFSTTYEIGALEGSEGKVTDGRLPIGRPISNSTIYILDAHLNPVPVGVAGEIYVGGDGVGCGYLNRAELTAQRFLRDPFCAGGRLYRTGDLGRWRGDGNVEFLGRNDGQVKIRGFRIEPGEIEARLLRHPGVKDAAVIAREDSPGLKQLVAYVVCEVSGSNGSVDPAGGVLPEVLRTYLRGSLPEYMVPGAFVVLERLPLTPNGKLDRKALPAPELGAYATRAYEAPWGELEEILAGIWGELLNVDRVGRGDNFFELGGHSLLILQMMERLRRVGLAADARCVFERPTLADLAGTIRREAVGARVSATSLLPLVELEPGHLEPIVQSVPGGTENIEDIYPLVPVEEGILFHYLLNEGRGDTYILSMLLAASSRDGVERLVAALQYAIDRYDILRSAIRWESLPQPVRVVYRRAALAVEEIALEEGSDPLEQLAERLRPGSQKLDLQRAPLMGVQIARHPGGGQWYALVHLHHLVCDHESVNIMFAELTLWLRGQAAELPKPARYRDHVAEVLAHRKAVDSEAFFREKLGDVDESTLPFGLVDVHGDGARIHRAVESVEPRLASRALALARRLGVSPAALFHAGWALVVACTSGRDDVVFGTVLLGRLQTGAQAQRALGMLINTLPLRIRLADLTPGELVLRTHRELSELLQHEQASLVEAQRCSGVAPLFNSLLNYRHSAPGVTAEFTAAVGVELLKVRSGTNYPIVLSVDAGGDSFILDVEADERAGADRMLGYMRTALESLVGAVERDDTGPAWGLAVLPSQERHYVLEALNFSGEPGSMGESRAMGESSSAGDSDSAGDSGVRDGLIHRLFEAQVERVPGKIAVVCGGRSLTYAQLNEWAEQVAGALRAGGVGPDQRVGLLVRRSVEMVVGILGILKAGGAYVPLDPDYPAQRLGHILTDALPRVVLTHGRMVAEGKLLAEGDLGRCIADLGVTVVGLDEEWVESARNGWSNGRGSSSHPAGRSGHSDGADHADGRSQDLGSHAAYVIYTSGSTGTPKGVVVEHRNVVSLWGGLERIYGELPGCDRIGWNAAFTFDASVQQLVQLLSGRTLFLVPEGARQDPALLLRFIEDNRIEGIDCTPSQIKTWICEGLLESGRAHLRLALIGGEAIDPQLWDSLARFAPTRFYNLYGPTECTVDVTAATLVCDSGGPNIGRPMADRRVYLLDSHQQPVPLGLAGEIFIGGSGIGRGYLNRPELTAGRFVGDPFVRDPAARMYRTGDLGRWRADGAIEYLGRNDDQVKIRGFRIELGEIEAALASHAWVKEAAVVAREDVPGEKYLAAYVVLHGLERDDVHWSRGSGDVPGGDSVCEELRRHLRAVLPGYMVPGGLMLLERLPLSSSGKLNRRALPVPELQQRASSNEEGPQGELEERLAAIWRTVLRVERIGRDHDFFELGGHSLLATRVVSQIRRELGVEVSVRTLFEAPSLRQLSASIAAERGSKAAQESSWMNDLSRSLRREIDEMNDAEVAREIARLREELSRPAARDSARA